MSISITSVSAVEFPTSQAIHQLSSEYYPIDWYWHRHDAHVANVPKLAQRVSCARL